MDETSTTENDRRDGPAAERQVSQLPKRIRNALRIHFRGVGDIDPADVTPEFVADRSEFELLKVPGVGPKGVQEIIKWLRQSGLNPGELHTAMRRHKDRHFDRYQSELDECAERLRLAGYTVTKPPNVGVQRRPAHDGRDPQDGRGPSAATMGSASGAEAKGN